jgi:hypothetical protein
VGTPVLDRSGGRFRGAGAPRTGIPTRSVGTIKTLQVNQKHMNDATIQEIAKAIVKEQFFLNWQFYLIFIFFTIIGSSIGTFLNSYFKNRGKNYATKTDFDELLKQLRTTTSVAEEIKISVSHGDWILKEWKTLRRLKLEDLISLIQEFNNEISIEFQKTLYGSVDTVYNSQKLITKIRTIISLYFPELYNESVNLLKTQETHINWLASHNLKLIEAKLSNNTDEYNKLKNVLLDKFKECYPDILNSTAKIEMRTPEILKQIIGI